MGHHWRLPVAARVTRWTYLRTSLGFLLVCALLASFASAADATTYDMRGEWSVTLTSPQQSALSGVLIINKMEPSGEFSGSGQFAGGAIQATITGTVSGTKTSVTIPTTSSLGNITFIAEEATIDTIKNSLSGTGKSYENGKQIETAEITATRIKTYQEVQEREARERMEHEEALARGNVRGEWAVTLEAGPQTIKGIAVIDEEANAKNEFKSSSALFEGAIPGTFSGTLKGGQATVDISTEAAGAFPAASFLGEAIAVTSNSNPKSMTGSGTVTVGTTKLTGTLTATKIKTYQEVKELEEAAQRAKEQQEKEAGEAKKAQEAKEAKEAEEARAKQSREAKEKLEKEATQKQLVTLVTTTSGPLACPEPAAKALTVSAAGELALKLTSSNDVAVQGHLTLVLPAGGKASTGKGAKTKDVTLGEGSFAISAHGEETVHIQLSRKGRTELRHHTKLRAILTIATSASGAQAGASKSYTLTLRNQASHGKR